MASRPKLLSPPWKILRHGWALTSFLGFPVGNKGEGWGEGKALILCASLASVLSFIHLELGKKKKKVLGITQTHPYGIDL